MIVYKNILEKFNAIGYSPTSIRREKLLSESVLTRIRNNQPLSTETLDKICNILKCDLSEIVEHRPDDSLPL